MTGGKAYTDVTLRPSLRQLLIDELVPILGALALLVAGGLDAVPGHPVCIGIALALVAKVVYSLACLRKMEYTITGEQLVYEHGVFTRSRDYIELYRVVDFDEKRSFLQLLLGLKTVVVHSGDRTMPKLKIVGIREKAEVVECLRERVSYNRKRMNIHEFANYR
ncbi:MAG: PH domain-containing protein [Bacteroidales bacterium]|jgi:uncharacterized membrane protein YdbT with pleckstrin-like domain|nr:PH domain-containing protein [Bacteroidales bacterium]